MDSTASTAETGAPQRRRGQALQDALLDAPWEEFLRFPFDLLRHELMMPLGPVPNDAILEIVDDLYLPLVMKKQ